MTEPTKPAGAKIKGGTVTFAEQPGSPPNYIFPLYPAEYCGAANGFELSYMLYRPLYWFGSNYSPAVDYDRSIGQKPIYSNGGKTVTIHLNHYMWSDGEQVSARDVVFWMNLLKVNPAADWCPYAPDRFPDNVTSYKAVNTTTVQLTFNKAYNPNWLLYQELSQIHPVPIAWDRTSLVQKAPTPAAANLPDATKSGAAAVLKFLSGQAVKISDWGNSPLWDVVDGAWRVQSTTTNGGVTLVPNAKYSGSPKPQIAKFVEMPFTSEASLVDEMKSQGPNGVTLSYIPPQYQPLTSSFKSEGYDINTASTYSLNYFNLNFNNPTVGPIFRQLYFRQALQHLVDQQGWIQHFLHDTAVPTYGPVPMAPPSSFLGGVKTSTNPYPFSVSDASLLLKSNGWKVAPGGQTTCERPGTGTGECGAGVKHGQRLAFTIDYVSDTTSVEEEMLDLQLQARKVGIEITLTTHPYDTVLETAVKCKPSMPACSWEAENSGSGWIYAVYPSGEDLFESDATSNSGSYADARMDGLIDKTITAPASQELAAMKRYSNYATRQLPVVYLPQSVGAWGSPTAGSLVSSKLGGFTANAIGFLSPEDWYLTK